MHEAVTIETVTVKMYPDGRMDTKNAALYLGFEEKTLAMKRVEAMVPALLSKDGFSISRMTWTDG